MSANSWAYGVTTVPDRVEDLLPRTLNSLALAGFSEPRLFIDGECNQRIYDKFGLKTVFRGENIRTYGNWILGMWELFIRNPTATYYAMFQDDMVTYKNLRNYLDSCTYPEKGYWNLYSFPQNEKRAPEIGCGWHLTNQLGKGAVGLIFDRDALITVLSHQHMVMRPLNAHKGHKSVDGGIVEAMKKAGYQEWCHSPSLIQHTGAQSSMGNRTHQLSTTFKSEEFDALELCPN